MLTKVSGAPIDILRPILATDVSTWTSSGLTWIRARVDDAPPWEFTQLPIPADIDRLPFPPRPDQDARMYWAWQDEAAGTVRARFFAPDYGVPEDEATGSAALRLTAQLSRPITIFQGQGSLIFARPTPGDVSRADIGGFVVEDEPREV